MNLFLTVWTMQDWDEPEWTVTVNEADHLDITAERKVIGDFMLETHELESDDFELVDAWTNRVDEVNGYTVKVEKK